METHEVIIRFKPEEDFVKTFAKKEKPDGFLKSFMGKGKEGGLLKAFSGAGAIKSAAILTGILGVVVMLVSSTKSLMNTIKGLFKLISMIGRMFTDIVAVALMPLIFVLRPLAMFLRYMMLPYKQAMMESMKVGNEFYMLYLQTGKQSEELLQHAVESWGLSMGFALKPIFNIISMIVEQIVIGMTHVILTAIASVISLIPGMTGVAESLLQFRDETIVGIRESFESFRQTGDDVWFSLLEVKKGVLAEAKEVIAEFGGIDDAANISTFADTMKTRLDIQNTMLMKAVDICITAGTRLSDWKSARKLVDVHESQPWEVRPEYRHLLHDESFFDKLKRHFQQTFPDLFRTGVVA